MRKVWPLLSCALSLCLGLDLARSVCISLGVRAVSISVQSVSQTRGRRLAGTLSLSLASESHTSSRIHPPPHVFTPISHLCMLLLLALLNQTTTHSHLLSQRLAPVVFLPLSCSIFRKERSRKRTHTPSLYLSRISHRRFCRPIFFTRQAQALFGRRRVHLSISPV